MNQFHPSVPFPLGEAIVKKQSERNHFLKIFLTVEITQWDIGVGSIVIFDENSVVSDLNWYELLYTIIQNHQVSSNLTWFWQMLCKEVVRKFIKMSWKRSGNTSLSPFLELRPMNYPYLDINHWFCGQTNTLLP